MKTMLQEPIKSTTDDRRSVEVTIYNDDFALVKEQRCVKIAAGEGELQFVGVPSRIDPVTVRVKPLGDNVDFTVLEQNYEYDLISHAKLMDKYIGQKIKIIEWNQYQDRKEIVEAELLSVENGEVYKIDNEIYLGHSGIKILPKLPDNLISRPTLSWIYHCAEDRSPLLEVSYMTSRMGWSADYIFIIDSGEIGNSLSGWVTINNRCGAEFLDAKLKLVAGEVNHERISTGGGDEEISCCSVSEPKHGFEESELFEYHLYDLQRSTTIKNNQRKQIRLMEASGIEVTREYTVTTLVSTTCLTGGRPIKRPVAVSLAFKNTKENNLGNPLPAGTVRIYTADREGSQQFIGSDSIEHTPKGEEVRLNVGKAFDIVAERTQTDFRQIAAKLWEIEWAITVRNRKEEDIAIGIIEHAVSTWEVRESTHKYVKADATTLRFDISVEKNGEVTIKYKMRIGI
jgi:hypothetical protein